MDDVTTTCEMMSSNMHQKDALSASKRELVLRDLHLVDPLLIPAMLTWTLRCQDFILSTLIIYFVRFEPRTKQLDLFRGTLDCRDLWYLTKILLHGFSFS